MRVPDHTGKSRDVRHRIIETDGTRVNEPQLHVDVSVAEPGLQNGDVLTYVSPPGVWRNMPATGGTPGGNNADIQFNDGGVFRGENNFEYNKTAKSVKLGAVGNVATGTNSFAQGDSVEATGNNSTVIGRLSQATGSSAFAIGEGALASRHGQFSHSSKNRVAVGDTQFARIVLRRTTTNNVRVPLNSPTHIELEDGRTYAYRGLIVGRTEEGPSKAFAFAGACRRDGGVTADITLPPSPGVCGTWPIGVDTSVLSLGAEVAANPLTNRLEVSVTGEGGTTINWVAVVEWVEVV